MIFRFPTETIGGAEARLIYEKLEPVSIDARELTSGKEEQKKKSLENISTSDEAKIFVTQEAEKARSSLEKKTTSWKQGKNDDDFRNDTLYQTGLLEIKKIEQQALHALDAIKANDCRAIEEITQKISDSLGELLSQTITSHTSTHSFEAGQFSKKLEEVFTVLDEAKLDWTGWSMLGEDENEVSPQETKIKEKLIEIFSDPAIQKYVEKKKDNPFLTEAQNWIKRFSSDRSAYSVSDTFVEELIKTLGDKQTEVKAEAEALKEKETIESAKIKLTEWNQFFNEINTNLQDGGMAVIERPADLLVDPSTLQYEQALNIDGVGEELVIAIQAHMNKLREEWGERGNATTDQAIKDIITSWEKDDSAENRLSKWNQDTDSVTDGLATAKQVSVDLKEITALIVEAEKKTPEVTPVNTAIDKVAIAAQAIIDTTNLTSDQKNALATALTELKAQLANGNDEIKGQITKLEGQLKDQGVKIEDLKKEIETLKVQLEALKISTVSTQTTSADSKSPESGKKAPEKREDKYRTNWSVGEMFVDTSLQGQKYNVTASSLNVRDQNGNKIGLLHAGDEVTIIDGEGRKVIKEKFIKVQYGRNGKKEGWVALSYLASKTIEEKVVTEDTSSAQKIDQKMLDAMKEFGLDPLPSLEQVKKYGPALGAFFKELAEPFENIIKNEEVKQKIKEIFVLIKEDPKTNKLTIETKTTELKELIKKLQQKAVVAQPAETITKTPDYPAEFLGEIQSLFPHVSADAMKAKTVQWVIDQGYRTEKYGSRDMWKDFDVMRKDFFAVSQVDDPSKTTVSDALFQIYKREGLGKFGKGGMTLQARRIDMQESGAHKLFVEEIGGRGKKLAVEPFKAVFQDVLGQGAGGFLMNVGKGRIDSALGSLFGGVFKGVGRTLWYPIGAITNIEFEKFKKTKELDELTDEYMKELKTKITQLSGLGYTEREWSDLLKKKYADISEHKIYDTLNGLVQQYKISVGKRDSVGKVLRDILQRDLYKQFVEEAKKRAKEKTK